MYPQFVNDTTKLFTTSLTRNFFSMLGVLEHPFLRGSVHIKLTSAYSFDLQLLMARSTPIRHLLKGNGIVYQPGYYKLTKKNIGGWIKFNLQSKYYPASTCAILPRKKGGVVDEKFRVFRVKELRIVDASVFPIMPRAIVQSFVYAMSERASEFILQEGGR
ncbi:alcohol/choline dehydrogenase-like protein [Leptodontidium sp. 2 PMI_412]|nr:alcohol/choline dehydrogenase-like protein [Leptodontidium sp. 2 PMI_412]